MKTISLALLAMIATLHAAPAPSQTVERYQAAATLKYPALKQSGSPLNQQFLAIVAAKRQSEPAFFNQPDWPLRAADLAAEALKTAEATAQAKAKADEEQAKADAKAARSMTREQKEKLAEAELARERKDEAAQWEAQKEKWIFDRLMFGDPEDVIMRKLSASKLVTTRVSPKIRAELNSRYAWVIGERKFNIEFEMKDGLLTAISFGCLAEKTTELDTLVREDWDKLRAAAIERLGSPAKSAEFPATVKLRRGNMTVTDVWEKPGVATVLGVTEDGSMCHPTLRISDPTKTTNPGL